jgi:hypothetical protein
MIGSALARQPNPLPNPFRPGNGVPPPYLAGRDRLLAEAEDWLVEHPPLHANWALTGLRGTGKTVLLGEIGARAERAGWVTLERELGDRHRDDARLADAIADDCAALEARTDPLVGIGQAVARSARFLRPRRVMVGEVAVEPAYDRDEPTPTDKMAASLRRLSRSLASTDRRGALLLYDEAHLLADDRQRERYPLSSLLAALGHVQRAAPRVRLILSGLPTLSLNLKRARTYAERMFRHALVGNLDLDPAAEALAIPLAGAGRSFSLALIDRIVGETAGYPYFLQFFGAFACSRIGLVHIESSDFERVEGALLHELDLAFFEDRFLTASPAEQQLLGALAALGSRVSVRQLRGRVDSVGNVDELLRRLVDRGLLYRPTRGSYEFALPLFGAYLRRHAKLTQLTPAVSSGRAADR